MFAAFALLLTPAAAATAPSAIAALRAQDARVAAVGYRLASRGTAFCRADAHSAGLLVERASLYPRADRAAAGMGPLPVVTAVVPDSPAALAGVRVGDPIAAIDGVAEPSEDVAGAPDAYAPTAAVRARLAAALADGAATLSVARADGVAVLALTAPAGCASEFQSRPTDTLSSYADGQMVQVTSAVLDLARTDSELAAVVAHELAHNILHHPQTLKALGRPRKAVRRTEGEADRLSVYLLDAAGYSLDEAFAFRNRIARRTDWGLLSDGTHPGPAELMQLLAGERARIAALRAAGKAVVPPADLVPPAG